MTLYLTLKKTTDHFLRKLRKDKLLVNAGYIFGVQVIPGVIGIGYWAVVGRNLTIVEIGLLSAVISLVALLSYFSTMGMNVTIIRFLPESKDRSHLINIIFSFVLLISILVSLIYIVGMQYWGQNLMTVIQTPLSIVIFITYVAIMALGNIIQNTFIAYREALYGLRYTLLSQGLRFVFLFFCIGFGVGLQYLIGSNLLAILLIVLFSLWFYLPKLEQSYKPGVIFDLPKLKELIPYGLGNHLATLLYQLPQLVFPLLILELLGATANGYAYIALMLGGFLTGPGLALANSAFAEGASDRGRSREILSRASLLGVLSTTILAAVVIFGAEWLLFLFGLDDASESVKLLRWLALASPIIVFNQLYFTYLRLEDRVPGLVALSSIMAIVTVVISIIFMPKIGIVACGIGIMVGNALLAILVGCRLSLKSPMDKGKSRRHLPRSNSMS